MHEKHAAAAAYNAAGYRVILLRAFSKEPAAREWQRPENAITADLSSKFNVGGNLGLLLGSASGGLVDVDLDSPEACRLAPALLPATAEFGRKSKLP